MTDAVALYRVARWARLQGQMVQLVVQQMQQGDGQVVAQALAQGVVDAWLEGEYPGARRPVTARLIERWEVAS